MSSLVPAKTHKAFYLYMPNIISFYNKLPAKGQPHVASGTMTINDFLWAVKSGKWQKEVEAVRRIEDKEARDIQKCKLVSVTVSGTFINREEKGLLEHSGFICMDIDNCVDKTHVEADPYTYCLFDSASAKGFAIVVKIDPQKHKESFQWLKKYYYETYGLVVDNKPQNVASMRFVSYDNKLEIHEKSKQAKSLAREFKPQKNKLTLIVTNDKAEEYVNEAYTRGINIAEGYEEYLNLSFALANGFGASGRSYFHKLASVSQKYKEQQADRQYDLALARNMPGITVGTFYYMLKQAGITITSEPHNAVAVAAIGKRAGKKQDTIVDQLVRVNNFPIEQATQLVKQVYEREDITLQTIAFDPERLIETLKQYIDSNYSLRRNSITKKLEDKKEEWSSEKMNTMFIKARATFNSPSVTHDLCERMVHSEFTPDYNPITEYIEKNRWRNSQGNVAKLIATIETNTPMKDVFILKWCISLFAAHSGEPVRNVLTLVGGQLTGKTQWFRRLLPKDLKIYYGESKLDAGKDDYLLMCTKWILMNDEMGGKSKHDEKLFKELTSKEVFSLRAPYGRYNADYYRLALLCGTSNELDIMQDPTGNTRILPIEVISINHELYNSIDKDELLMELYRMYEIGDKWSWNLTPEEIKTLHGLSQNFEGINHEREAILNLFEETNSIPGAIVEEMTSTQIKDYIETNSRQQIRNLKALGMQLRLLYGHNKMKRNVGHVYKVIKRNKSENNLSINGSAAQPPSTHVAAPPQNDIVKNNAFDTDLPF